jgi:eukaryotic-like serine/threonine-protein kinase
VRRLIKFFLLGLVLLLVAFSSALLAMRFAIHGREVRVPKLWGLHAVEAEKQANAQGLVLTIENRFYSNDVPAGYIVSQSPGPDTKVRRGWKVRVAESLGPQRAAIPNVVGQSERLAELNISRRGLELGTVATIHYPGATASTVITQNPAADEKNAASPRIGLVVAAPDNRGSYLMPNFVGQPLADATAALKQAGLNVDHVSFVEDTSGPSGNVLRQSPVAGKRIEAGAGVILEVRK